MPSLLISVLAMLPWNRSLTGRASRRDIVLRHQVQVLQRSRPRRICLSLTNADGWRWAWLSKGWPSRVRAPSASAYAERFVRSINEECLDRLIPLGRPRTGGTTDGIYPADLMPTERRDALLPLPGAAHDSRGDFFRVPRHLTTDHDPLFEAHRWRANLRILETSAALTDVQWVSYGRDLVQIPVAV